MVDMGDDGEISDVVERGGHAARFSRGGLQGQAGAGAPFPSPPVGLLQNWLVVIPCF
jgi:hypothetical protein